MSLSASFSKVKSINPIFFSISFSASVGVGGLEEDEEEEVLLEGGLGGRCFQQYPPEIALNLQGLPFCVTA